MNILADTLNLVWDRNRDRATHMERSFACDGSLTFELVAGDVLTTERVYEAIRENGYDDMSVCAEMLKRQQVKWGVRIVASCPHRTIVEVTIHWDEGAEVPEREMAIDNWRDAA